MEKNITETDEQKFEKSCKQFFKKMNSKNNNKQSINHGGNIIYCLGFIGATIFFINQSTSFWTGILGILKAIVWPAYLVYEAFRFLIG
jgi:hypothetical protein